MHEIIEFQQQHVLWIPPHTQMKIERQNIIIISNFELFWSLLTQSPWQMNQIKQQITKHNVLFKEWDTYYTKNRATTTKNNHLRVKEAI